MNKKDKAILDWVRKHRPEHLTVVARILEEAEETSHGKGVYQLIYVAFEAGRDFQKSNPDAPDGPSAYL